MRKVDDITFMLIYKSKCTQICSPSYLTKSFGFKHQQLSTKEQDID